MSSPGSSVVPPKRVEIAVAVVEHDGQVLIGLRGPAGPLAGFWEFPGGKLDQGESPEHAARRECWEETGLAIRVVGVLPTAEVDYPHGSLRIYFCTAVPLGTPGELPERFRWVKHHELANYQFPPANDEVLRLLAPRPTG